VLGQDPQALRESDPRGPAKPDVATQTTSIEQLGTGVDLEPDEAEARALHDDPQATTLEPLPEHAKTVDEVDAAANRQKSAILAKSQARENKVRTTLGGGAHRRTKADGQKQLASKQGQRAAETHKQSKEQARTRKHASKDELRAKLTETAETKRRELTEKLEAKKAELETTLQAKLAKLLAEQEKQNQRLSQELDKRVVKLEADIAKRKEKHDQQIAKERVALEKVDSVEQEKARAKGKADADAIKTEAASQAKATQTNAEKRAAETEAKGDGEAKAAITAGDSKASQAEAAAEARAKQLDAERASEAAAVRSEGTHRAKMARDAASKRAADIRAKAKADATKLRAKGKADHDKQIADGDKRAAQALKNGEDAAAKIQQKTLASIAAMQAKSDAAVAAMQAELAAMKADVEAKRADMNTKAQTSIEDVKSKLEAEKTKALAAMEQESAKTLAAIEAKVAADLAKIDAANEKDLARLEQQIERDIREINASVKRAEQKIDQAVARAEQKAQAMVTKECAQIRADASKIVRQLDQMAAQARKRIAAADKNTRQQIQATADLGLIDVTETAAKAQQDLEDANKKLVDETAQQGAANRAEADKLAADSQAAMEASRKGLDKEINQAWVDDAVKKANAKLDDTGLFNIVTDGEANEAMNILNSLPAEQQGEAIAQLDKAAFDNLLDQVPEERREEFRSLVENTQDPERKLKLWGEQHKSQVQNDAEKERQKTADEGPWYWFDNAEQDRNERLNDRREEIVESSLDEVDDEMKVLLEKHKNGTLTAADVDAVMKRKDHEHQIEMKYNVNLTNKEGTRADGTKIAWTDSELSDIESALAHMPEAHVKDNELLKEIRRSDKHPTKSNVGGNHSKGVIQVFDLGVTGTYRHTGDTHELADPSLKGVDGKPLAKTGDPIAQLEEVLAHEIGHDIHDQYGDEFERYKKAAGWNEDVGNKQMKAAGLTDDQIANLKSGKVSVVEGSDGKLYKPDPYHEGEVLAYDKGAIPELHKDPSTGARLPGSSQPNSASGGDTWNYANTNHKDHFAEHYTKAINAPEKLAQDMLDAPKERVAEQTTARDTAATDLATEKAKSPPDPAKVTALESALADEQKKLDDAIADQAAQKTQYDIMRNDIFHADKATDDAAKRLEAKGVDPAKIAEFRAKAERAQTPQQVDLIASQY